MSKTHIAVAVSMFAAGALARPYLDQGAKALSSLSGVSLNLPSFSTWSTKSLGSWRWVAYAYALTLPISLVVGVSAFLASKKDPEN